jgi:hypothetical protein
VVVLAAGDQLSVEVNFGPGPDAGGGGQIVDVTDEDLGLRRPAAPTPARRLGLSVSAGTNTLELADTGTALIGLHLRAASRLELGVDVVTVAWAILPSVRVRLAGERLALHAIVAAPIAFTDGDESEAFVAGAGGLGLRWFVAEAARLALRAEVLVSVAGGDHGVTVPAFVGGELWF